MNIFVGTASWTDPSLIACKRFYPRGCHTAEARLRHYARTFPFVEVDSAYYSVPDPYTAETWVSRTPEAFIFNIKAFRVFTGHWTTRNVLHSDIQKALPASSKSKLYMEDFPSEILDELWRHYLLAIEPLKASGKLGAVHFQFAPWIESNSDGQALVRRSVERMTDYPVAVEFRHSSWFAAANQVETLALQRDLGVTHTIVDGPQGFSNSVPSVWEATNEELAIVRLHGRNHETWNIQSTTAADRFNYDYSREELAQLVPQIRAVAKRVKRTQVIFNNNTQDQGQRNALTLMDLLGLEYSPPPLPGDQLVLVGM